MIVEAPGKEDLQVSVSKSEGYTDREGRLKPESGYYFLKLKYAGNYFSFNMPERVFAELSEFQKADIIIVLLKIYNQAFQRFQNIMGFIPEGYKFNVTFAETESGLPFHIAYSYSKTSSTYTNFLPYEEGDLVMTQEDKGVLLHEIGHGLFGLSAGNLRNHKTRAIEEGFADYISESSFNKEGIFQRVLITPEQGEKIKGLSQLDVDASIWGEATAVRKSEVKGYNGVTHHVFGKEFLKAYMDTFGVESLLDFLKRLKKTEDNPSEPGDYGTNQIKTILKKMRFSD